MLSEIQERMAKIILEGWRPGLEKISLTKLQVGMLGKSLKESKSNVDSLLDGKVIVIEIDDLDLAREFCEKIDRVGVNCRILE